MKIVLDYKKGWFARVRKLKIYSSEDVFLIEMKQGERKEVELSEDTEFVYGKIDWGKTESFQIQNLSEGECLELVPFFTLNPCKHLGFAKLPIKLSVKQYSLN